MPALARFPLSALAAALVSLHFGLQFFFVYFDAPTRWRPLRYAAALALICTAIFTAIDMGESTALPQILQIFTSTHYGHAVLALLVVLALPRRFTPVRVMLAAILLADLGHAGAQTSWRPLISESVHIAAAMIWAGGLLGLLIQAREPGWLYHSIERFAKLAAFTTAALAASGLLLSYDFGLRLPTLLASRYGQTITAKILFFGIALLFAARNRFALMPVRNQPAWARHSRAALRWEITFVLIALLLAGALAQLEPPLHQ